MSIDNQSKMEVPLVNRIKNFIESDKDTIELEVMPLAIIEEAIESIGFKKIDHDTNGWQVDFWLTYVNNASKFELMLSGSLFYGKYNLSKIDK